MHLERQNTRSRLDRLVSGLNANEEVLSIDSKSLLLDKRTVNSLMLEYWHTKGIEMEQQLNGVKEKTPEELKDNPIFTAVKNLTSKHAKEVKETVEHILSDNYFFSDWDTREFKSEEEIQRLAEMLFEGVGYASSSLSSMAIGHNFERKIFDGSTKCAIDLYREGRGREVDEYYRLGSPVNPAL